MRGEGGLPNRGGRERASDRAQSEVASGDVDVIQKFGWIGGKRERGEGGAARRGGGKGGKNPIFSSFANAARERVREREREREVPQS